MHAPTTSWPTRHGVTTRQLGLPACRTLAAFGRGDFTQGIALLAGLPATAHRLGGSHAQSDVLHLTLLQAVQRIRRPVGNRIGARVHRGITRRMAGSPAPARPAARHTTVAPDDLRWVAP